MKIWKYLMMLSAAVAVASCELEPKDLFSTDPVAPVLTAHNAILLNGDADGEDVYFAWSAARNLEGSVTYTLEASYSDGAGTYATNLVEGTAELSYTENKAAFRNILISELNVPEYENFSFSVKVIAYAGSQSLESEAVTVEAFINAEDMQPELSAVEDAVLTMAEAKNPYIFEWSPAYAGANEAVTYTLVAHKEPLNGGVAAFADEDESEGDAEEGDDEETGVEEYVIAEGLTATRYETTVSAINNMLLDMGYEPEVAAEVYFTVKAYSDSYPEGLASESISARITPYVPKKVPVAGWSLIGVNGDWETDIDMIFTDKGLWVSPVTALNGEFKLRMAHGWDINLGAVAFNTFTPGTALETAWDGANFTIAEGNYYIVFDEVSGEVTAYESTTGFSLSGGYNGWGWDGADSYKLVEVEPGIYKTGEVFFSADEFKVREDNTWLGASFTGYGDVLPLGDSNVVLGATNIYAYVTYDSNANTITVDDSASVLKGIWSVTGDINGSSWDAVDVPMYEIDGVWRSVPFHYDTKEWGFKVRKDGEWAESYGGEFTALGEPFAATGSNVEAEELEGQYIYVIFDPAANTLTVNTVK